MIEKIGDKFKTLLEAVTSCFNGEYLQFFLKGQANQRRFYEQSQHWSEQKKEFEAYKTTWHLNMSPAEIFEIRLWADDVIKGKHRAKDKKR